MAAELVFVYAAPSNRSCYFCYPKYVEFYQNKSIRTIYRLLEMKQAKLGCSADENGPIADEKRMMAAESLLHSIAYKATRELLLLLFTTQNPISH